MDSAARAGPDDPSRPGARRTPVRTCLGCRRRDEQSALLRVVAVQDPSTTTWWLHPDQRRRGQGRGAYVHPDPECLRTALTRRAFGRALRLPAGAHVEAGTVPDWVRQQSEPDQSSAGSPDPAVARADREPGLSSRIRKRD